MKCTGGVLFGLAKFDQKSRNQANNNNVTANVLVPIPAKDLPQHLCDEKNAESDWLHFWHNLVGLWPQPCRLFHCFTCNSSFITF